MTKYRITYIIGQLNVSSPPEVLYHIFPNFDGSQEVLVTQQEIIVTFNDEQTPVVISPLVKVEQIS